MVQNFTAEWEREEGGKKTVSYHLVNVKVNVKNESTQDVTKVLPFPESGVSCLATFVGGL
jgi:hypothetical protein